MKKPSFLFAITLVLAGISCKHQAAATGSKAPSATTANEPQHRADAMSAKKAKEEEIFVQGCIEKSLGNTRKALGEFQEVLNMNPANAAANYEVAGLYWLEGQPDRALKYAKTAAESNPSNRWYQLRYAELLQENGQHDQATGIFRSMSEKEPENIDLLFRYAASLGKAGRHDEALKTYNRIESLEGISDTLAHCRVLVYKAMKDPAGEEKTLTALLNAFPGDIEHYYLLTDFYKNNNQPDKAAAIYQRMTQEFPYLPGPHLKLAYYYEDAHQHDKAFAEAVRGFGFNGSIDEKLELMNSWYPASDTAPALGTVQKKEADSLCRMLRRIHPDRAESFTVSANYLYLDGKFKEARELYRKAVALSDESYEPWKRILEINDKTKDDAAQLKDCNAVIELFPSQPDAYYYRGLILYAKKDYKPAIPDLESAIDYTYGKPEQDLKLKVMLITAYRAIGGNEKADDYAEDVMAKDSSNLEVIAGYCASLSEQHKKLYNASLMMRSVVEKDPGNASYMEILGWLEYQMNDYKEAKAWMEKALTKSPENARMNERMGDIQFRLGNTAEALRYWKKASALGVTKNGSNPALERKISTKTMLDTE
jgi:tetratricopeptide (TPR) repeat protein